jgi:uncharacterized protein (DUF427 family)
VAAIRNHLAFYPERVDVITGATIRVDGGSKL